MMDEDGIEIIDDFDEPAPESSIPQETVVDIDIPDEPKKEVPPVKKEEVPADFQAADMEKIVATDNSRIYDRIEKEEREYSTYTIDPDKLMDPNYLPFLKKILSIRRKKQNIMTYEEFQHFEPLFEKNNNLSGEEINDLFKEWQFRISLYEPVEVYKNGKIYYRIPPLFQKTNTVDAGVDSKTVNLAVAGFANACIHDDPGKPNEKKYYYGSMLAAAFNRAQAVKQKERVAAEKEAAIESAIVTGQMKPQVKPPVNTAPTSGKVSNNKPATSDVKREEPTVDESDVEYL